MAFSFDTIGGTTKGYLRPPCDILTDGGIVRELLASERFI